MSYDNRNHEYRNNNENEDEDDEDDDAPPEVDISQFRFPNNEDSAGGGVVSFGYNRGRSSPNQRKAMGRSAGSMATVHLCTNCGSEFVKWMGRCPTCKEWNTLQEHVVTRGTVGDESAAAAATPFFSTSNKYPSSWLDGIVSNTGTAGSVPVRATDLYVNNNNNNNKSSNPQQHRRERIRIPNDDEFNTVLGGGIMPGSLILVGGDPGVGKSTLLLQTAGSLAELCSTPAPKIGMGLPKNYKKNSNSSSATMKLGPVWYCSGEESPEQIADRAERLGIQSNELWLLAETHADSLCAQVVRHQQQYKQCTTTSTASNKDDEMALLLQPLPPSLLIIDSIQTMVCTNAGPGAAAGGITQVRECVALFLRLAKSTGIPIFLVGHVTKSGDVAGPRTVEHMVDAVLYLEGTANEQLRLLRASKNRFGSNHNVGVYEMTAGRLRPLSDPSSFFLSQRLLSDEDSQGCAVAIALEGMRPITVEVQALVTGAASGGNFGSGGGSKRNVNGIAYQRLMLLLGVLQKRCGIPFWNQDVYVNIAGRMQRLDSSEKAADLAVAVALVSSHVQIGVRSDTAFVGEVGLLGELRPVPSMDQRLDEARRMGFSRVVSAPTTTATTANIKTNNKYNNNNKKQYHGIEWIQCRKLDQALQEGLVKPIPKRSKARRQPPQQQQSNNNNPSEWLQQDIRIYDIDNNDNDNDSTTNLESLPPPQQQQKRQPQQPSPPPQQPTIQQPPYNRNRYGGGSSSYNNNNSNIPGRLADLGLDEIMSEDDDDDYDDDNDNDNKFQ